MTRRILVSALALPLLVLALVQQTALAVVNMPFDAAYMVAASGSTEPVDYFDIEGPAPWLYLDLPDGALTSFIVSVSTDWFRDSVTTKQFSLSESSYASLDKYWFSPSTEVWNSTKAEGGWHINARHSLINLIIIYGGGVGQVWANGSATIDFSVYSGMPGDLNGDYQVDAADYVVWRKSDGTQSMYDMWRANLGQTAGSGSALGSAANVAVPEPSAAIVLLMGMLPMFLLRRPRVS